MPTSGQAPSFVPIPEPAFIRDANLRHVLRSLRENVMAAFGMKGGSGFLPRAEYVDSGQESKAKSASAAASAASALRVVQCAYDVSAGVGEAGTHYLAATLPAGAVLVRAFCVVETAFSGDLGVELSIKAGTGDDEIDVFEESDLASAWSAGYHASVNVGQSAAGIARAFKAVVTGGDISDGKLRFFAEYASAV